MDVHCITQGAVTPVIENDSGYLSTPNSSVLQEDKSESAGSQANENRDLCLASIAETSPKLEETSSPSLSHQSYPEHCTTLYTPGATGTKERLPLLALRNFSQGISKNEFAKQNRAQNDTGSPVEGMVGLGCDDQKVAFKGVGRPFGFGFFNNVKNKKRGRSCSIPEILLRGNTVSLNFVEQQSKAESKPTYDRSPANVSCKIFTGWLSPLDTKHTKYVDFMYCLGKQSNHLSVVSHILTYLPPADLFSASEVSKTWHQIIKSDTQACVRLKSYIKPLKIFRRLKENEMKSDSQAGLLRRKSSLRDIRNFNVGEGSPGLSEQATTSTKPNEDRFNVFLMAGKNLDKSSRLMVCPKCTSPAHINEVTHVAACLQECCKYKFCSKCQYGEHGSRPCPRASVLQSKKRNNSVGSKQSKKNLRRL